MSVPLRWFHITINTRRSWLHGDPRGFRDRRHRIHSSGDYKHRPPPGEHAGLHRWAEARSGPAVVIPAGWRQPVAEALGTKASQTGLEIVTLDVAGKHAHLLAKMPDHLPTIKQLVGRWKQAASHAVRDRLPGKLWSEGCHAEPVRDRLHRRNVHQYILEHVNEGASVHTITEDIDALPW